MAEYVSVAEAAAALGLSERAIHKRIATGIMKAERLGLRTWLVPAAEVQRMKTAGRLKPGPKPGPRRTDGDGDGAPHGRA